MKKKTATKSAAKKLPSILKLNLGAGNTPMDGYVNLDRKSGQEIYPLDYPDNSADEIRASHVLEHFSHKLTQDVLNDWVRVLKPGGLIKIAVPDLNVLAALICENQNIAADLYIMGGHVDDDDHHGAAFTRNRLCEMFQSAGLERTRIWESDNPDCSGLVISLNLEARKPLVASGELEFKGVHMVLPTPRYGPSVHHKCIYEAIGQLRLRMHTVSGCFWNQHLCPAIETELQNPDCRYILTLDFDSVFSAQDIIDMYRIMETHPHIDALVPMQSHRGTKSPMFTIRGKSEVPFNVFDMPTCEITTGHFGLTLIRADKLRKLPRPWMVGVPANDGSWGEGHIDPDIYFWYEWEKAGNTVHLANHVVIGHIEDVVLWPAKSNLEPIPQKVTDYLQFGKPMEAK